MSNPILSIVIASYNSDKTIRKCLSSLMEQIDPELTEVIVIESSSDNTARIVKKEFPSVKLSQFSQKKSHGEACNIGSSVAQGKIVAFIGADCIAEKNWVNNILKAHQSSYVGIGGPVKNGNPESLIGWAVYLCRFGLWLPKNEASEMNNIPGCNISYKRWAFEKYGRFLEKNSSDDTFLNWNLYKMGYRLWFVPSISVYHINPTSVIESIKYGIVRGSNFAIVRAESKNFSRFRTAIYIILFPLLPIVMVYKYIIRVLNSTIPLGKLLLAFPFMVIGSLSWSIGEFLGNFSYFKNKASSLYD